TDRRIVSGRTSFLRLAGSDEIELRNPGSCRATGLYVQRKRKSEGCPGSGPERVLAAGTGRESSCEGTAALRPGDRRSVPTIGNRWPWNTQGYRRVSGTTGRLFRVKGHPRQFHPPCYPLLSHRRSG